jgi:hypothetical protein
MLGRATAAPYADALALLRDAVLGLLLAATSLAWAAVAIDLGNALVAGIGAVAIPTLGQAGFAGLALEAIVLGLVYLVLGILLVLQMLVRLALLDVLLIVAPLALLVGVLPQARHWTRLWADLFVGALLTQFLQILALRLGTGLLTQLVPTLSASLLTFLAGIAVLWLVLKVPGLLNAGLHRAGGSATVLGAALTYRGVARILASSGAAGGVGGAAATGSGPLPVTLATSLGSSPPVGNGGAGASERKI